MKIHFVELGAITAISEMAGFCFIVARSQPKAWRLWWEEVVSLNRFVCIGGFLITVALSVFLLFLLFLFKKQPKRGFIKLSACVCSLCSPYLFLLADAQRLYMVAAAGLLLLFAPVFVSSIWTNGVWIVYKRIEKKPDLSNDFRLGEVIWALISRYIGLAAALLALVFTPLKPEGLLYVNTLESVLLPLTAFSIAVILNFAYLSFGLFKVRLPENRRYILYAVLLSLLNAPYIFLYPIINNILVNGGWIRGMYAPM